LDLCHYCDHSVSDHIKHLQGQGLLVSELDRLLSIVVDVENLFMCVHTEKDPDAKQVYIYLFKVCVYTF
jgi:histone acetyltransferase